MTGAESKPVTGIPESVPERLVCGTQLSGTRRGAEASQNSLGGREAHETFRLQSNARCR
jgi:hypothetical protein